jgi:hypothetical protein
VNALMTASPRASEVMKLGSPLSAAISRAGDSGGARRDAGAAGAPGLAARRPGLDSLIRMARSFMRFTSRVSTPMRFVGD